MKAARVRFVILILLAAAACGRQPATSAPGAAVAGDSTISSDGYGSAGVHDPRAMTSIDVATGDLAALAGYGGGRAIAPRANRASLAFGQPAATLPPDVVEQLVAPAQQGGQTSPSVSPTTENSAIESESAKPPNGPGPDTVQPAQ